jgi:hypothetical protein
VVVLMPPLSITPEINCWFLPGTIIRGLRQQIGYLLCHDFSKIIRKKDIRNGTDTGVGTVVAAGLVRLRKLAFVQSRSNR